MPETPDEKQRLEALVKYFQDLTDNKNQEESTRMFEWCLGLHIAKRVLYISNSNPDDLSELRLLVKILEVGKGNFGSGWLDLYIHANCLLNRLLDKSK